MRGRERKLGALIVAACLGVFLLAVSTPAAGPSVGTHSRLVAEVLTPSRAGPTRGLPAASADGSGAHPASAPISVSLSVSNANVQAGARVTFELNISLVGCAIFDSSSLGELTISFGDGTSYQEPGNTGYSLFCQRPPLPNDTSNVEDFQYAYSNPGTYSVTAQVNWISGAPLLTNNVTVDVSGSPIAFAIDGWFYGVIGTVSGALVVVAVLRWKLPKPPSLPPGAT